MNPGVGDEEVVGVVLVLGSESGPKTGPRKNLEYSPRFTASRFAAAMRERWEPAFGSGVTDPEAGVPEVGLRFEMIPVDVRFRSMSWVLDST